MGLSRSFPCINDESTDIKALFERDDIVDVAGPWLANFFADHFLPVTEESSGDKVCMISSS
jgi:hypothetical protein